MLSRQTLSKKKRKVQRVPQSQSAALPRQQEEEENKKHKSKKNVRKALRLAPSSPNHKATKSKTNIETTALEQSVE